jgi:hypothetical protein
VFPALPTELMPLTTRPLDLVIGSVIGRTPLREVRGTLTALYRLLAMFSPPL